MRISVFFIQSDIKGNFKKIKLKNPVKVGV